MLYVEYDSLGVLCLEERMIKDNYKVLDTLYTDESQSVFICGPVESDKEEKYIISEFSDKDIIDAIRDSFLLSGDTVSKSLTETFDLDDKFYTVFPMVDGITLEEYLAKHNLTLADKMHLTEELLKKFIAIDKSNNAIQYVLCDLNNISVQNRRYLAFNNLFFFKKENLNVSSTDVLKKLGYIVLCIFANTPNADAERQKDVLPPAIFSIVSKCIEGGYNSIYKIYEDFKKTLLYTTFIDTGSLDNQIRHRIIKAQKKRSTGWMKNVAGILILAALLGGGYWLLKDKIAFTGPGRHIQIDEKRKNNPPTAEFSISVSKVYKDDDVTFIDKSIDSDPGDVIKSRLWTIEKEGTVIMNSDTDVFSYLFDEIGEYKVSLIVQDSKGANSKPYEHKISVLDKPELPDELGADTDSSKDRK